MRIIHVATLVTPDGAYGGPIRVALNQLEELQSLGHEVELVAGTAGFDSPPTVLQGVPVSLFPARLMVPGTGFAGLVSPKLQRYLTSRIKSVDIVQVHVARDLITLPAALAVNRLQTPLILQPHGMIDESTNPLAACVDVSLTRKLLRASKCVLALTEDEARSLRNVAKADINVERIVNGVRPTSSNQPSSDLLEFLFLARLHPRKRAPMFVEAAIMLLRAGVNARFTLVGPDEGDGQKVRSLIAQSGFADRLAWEGPMAPAETSNRMQRSSVFVLPSVGEVLSMSMLEAMSLGLPVVITESNGLAPAVRSSESGLVTDGSFEDLVDCMRKIATRPSARITMGENARRLVEEEYSIASVAHQLERTYESATMST